MFFPLTILLEATRQSLQSSGVLPDGVASIRESVLMALDVMLTQQHDRSGEYPPHLDQMSAVLTAHNRFNTMAHPEARSSPSGVSALRELEAAVLHPAGPDSRKVDTQTLSLQLCELEVQMLSSLVHPSTAPAANDDTILTEASWQAYLRRRFDEPDLRLSAFRPLPGGFGKQTFLFSVEGRGLCGDYVLRRDMAEPMFRHGCHRVDHEYALIRDVFSRGFPAPDAVWLDTEHADLPGGDFFVMRRSPGTPGGSVFSSAGQVPADLVDTLAAVLARLHALSPVAGVHETIAPELWTLTRSACTRRYISKWLDVFSSDVHLPSPSIASLLMWLLENVPDTAGTPVLLHGDIGFHNFLFNEGRLSTVLDWEFSHVGDPAEDLAYVRNTLGEAIDWPAFIQAYVAHGGQPITPEQLRYFQVWGHVRNACSASIAAAKLADGRVKDLKLVLLPFAYIPLFLRAAAQALAQGETHVG